MIYLIVQSYGSWDTYGTKVVKAFRLKEDAQKYKDKKNGQIEKLREYVYKITQADENDEIDLSAEDPKYWFKNGILEVNGYSIQETELM